MISRIPKEVLDILSGLEKAGFSSYIVGGCVRDLFLNREPQDWDITTNATPEEVQKVFPKNFYENEFFTVTVLTDSEDPKLKEIEITTFRAEFEYRDRRRPGKVEYAKTIEEDLSRRDFTVNAMALCPKRDLGALNAPKSRLGELEILDPLEGRKDLEAKFMRAVGTPGERFKEDALRMMRAVRLSCVLGFIIEKETKEAILLNSLLLKEISQERIRDEFSKIIMSPRAMQGIEMLRETKLLQYIIPELEEGWQVGQNKHHIFTVWEHNLKALEYAAKKEWSLGVRLASLLHDVAKPRVKRGEGIDSTFYAHEVVGARMTQKILDRLKFSKKDVEKMTNLVRYHLFYYNAGEVTESSVRRLMRNIGIENVEDLLQVRMADRIGSGVPKAEPYKLRHLRYIIDKVSQDPISPSMLRVNGQDVMRVGGITPGPRIGYVLSALLEDVLEDPAKNIKEYLEKRTAELLALSDAKLKTLGEEGKKEKEKVELERDEETKEKYFVK